MTELAGELLHAGAGANRIHSDYVTKALNLLAEVEIRSLLAASGDRGSLAMLEDLVGRLSRLEREAIRELDRYSGRD